MGSDGSHPEEKSDQEVTDPTPKQGGQVGGPTAQNVIWGFLRFWWAAKFFCPTAHKIWRFGAVLENF